MSNDEQDKEMRRRAGFTLIELLVVVAIIAVLISILVPSLKEAREQAQQIVCMSNKKQVALGLFMYADDYYGAIPASMWDVYGNGLHWVTLIVNGGYVPMAGDWGTGNGNEYGNPNWGNVYYSKNKNTVWVCPTLKRASFCSGYMAGTTPCTAYSDHAPGYNRAQRLSTVPRPGTDAMLICHGKGGSGWYAFCNGQGGGDTQVLSYFIHHSGDSTSVVFKDGHGEKVNGLDVANNENNIWGHYP